MELKLFVLSIADVYRTTNTYACPSHSLLSEIRHSLMRKVKQQYKCTLELSTALLYSLGFYEPRLLEEYSDTSCSQISFCFTDGQDSPQITHVSTKLSKTSYVFQTQNEIVNQHVPSSYTNTTLFYVICFITPFCLMNLLEENTL